MATHPTPQSQPRRHAPMTKLPASRRIPITLVIVAGCLATAVSCRGSGSKLSATGIAMIPESGEGYRLYTAHCSACHGPSGGGDGPAAIAVGIRPRAFLDEPFRYVSSLDGTPTLDDLVQTIRSGRRLGDMPAHPHLTDKEIHALVDYVRELSRIGWAARIVADLEEGDELSAEEIDEISAERVAFGEPVSFTWPAPKFQPDTAIGRRLYMEACASCHGPSGTGDGLDMPLDDRGKPIAVRDLTSGEFQGGTDLDELFKRFRCGVPGTPMPAQEAMSDEQIWQLVYYVRFLAGLR